MDIDEQEIRNFLKKRGLRAEEFTKQERRQSKTPDFRVFKGDKLAFFCEVKTISSDEWLDRQLDAAPPLTIVGGVRNDPIPNRLSNKIHEAVQQFDTVNPNLQYPNVLAFVNHDEACLFDDYLVSRPVTFSQMMVVATQSIVGFHRDALKKKRGEYIFICG